MHRIGNLQPPSKILALLAILIFTLINEIKAFTFSSAAVSIDNAQINLLATYTVSLMRSNDDLLNPTNWNTTAIPSSATATIIFPSQFSASQLSSYSCSSVMVNFNPVIGYTCSLSNNTIIISNLFTGTDFVSQVDVTIDNIVNPSSALTTFPFIGTINTDISNNSTIAELSFTPKALLSLDIYFKGGVVNKTSDMIVTLTTADEIPSDGLITIKFPSTLVWTREISANHLIPINGTLSCYGVTPEINNASISCMGLYSTQVVTISYLFLSNLAANKVVTFGIQGLFAPPTTEQIDSLTITTCDAYGNSINTKSGIITGYVAQTLTTYNMQSSLTTPMGVNNFVGGLTFTFTLTDTIIAKDYFVITFPSGTTITYTQSTSTIKLSTVTYNSTSLMLTVLQNTTNSNYNSGASITITFIRFRAPPSTKTTSAINFSILNNGFSKMIASSTITAIANNYTLTVGSVSKIINVYTSYNFTFTMSDALSSTGYIVIILDPLLCVSAQQKSTITTNLTVTISGTSIKSAPSTQITSVVNNGQSTYQLLLSNLNTSSSSIPTQSITITVSNLLNPNYVTSLTSFSLATYYSSSNDLVANANYASSIKLQTGVIILTSIASTATTTYTFTVLSIIFQNTNIIPTNGYIILQIPSDLVLLSASQANVLVAGSLISQTYSNQISNNSIIIKISSSISATSTVTLSISNIMTQSSTQTTSTFIVYSYDSAFNAVDQSTNSLGLSITSGNNFNSISLARTSSRNNQGTNYTITFQQIQNFTNVAAVSFSFNSILSTSSLSKVYEVTSGVSTACIFQIINSSYILVTLSQSTTSTHTIILQTIKNPPSYAVLNQPIQVSTLTSDHSSIYSQMYTEDIINTDPWALIVNSYSFSSNIYSSPTNLVISISGISAWPTLTYSLVINIPSAIGINGASCSSNISGLSCSFFAPTNTLTVSMSSATSLPLNIALQINSLTAPVYGSGPQTFTLTTFDTNSNEIGFDNSTVIFSNNCSLICQTCSNTNSSACLTCYGSSVSNLTLLYSQTCVSSCPSNTYQQNLTCIICLSSCLTCTVSSNNCSSCNSTNNSSAIYYYNLTSSLGSCLASCNTGTYQLNSTCYDCLSTCSKCNSTSFCYQCQTGYYYYNGTCLLQCPNSTLTNITNSSCSNCDSPCYSCSNITSSCLSCLNGYVLYNNSCSSTCPAANLFIINQTCSPCDSSCGTCFGISSNCTSCNQTSNNSHFYNFTCLALCPSLYYSSVTTSICLPCSTLGIGCSNCSTATTCLSCDTGFLYFPSNSSCLNSTPNGYFSINGTLYPCNSTCNTCITSLSNCTSCTGNLSLYENQCLNSCPINTTISINNTCQLCSYPCNTCFNSTSTCLSCLANSSLYLSINSYSCVNSSSCPNSTFADNSSLSCLSCNSSCVVCSGISTNCSQCSSSYYLISSNNICSLTCPNTTVPVNYSSGNICQNCSYPCTTCSGIVSFCLSCNSNSTLFLNNNGSCVSNTSCPQGTFANYTSSVCDNCVYPCSTCLSAAICSTCQANYSLIASNKTCTNTCPVGQAPSIVNGSSVCTLCNYPCSTCSLNINNCTSCASNSSLFLQGNICVNSSSCLTGTYPNSTTNICQACLSSCLNCTSLQNCSICANNYYLQVNTSACVTSTSCLNGTVSGFNSTSARNECLTCTSPCITCSISVTHCSSCSQANATLFLLNGSCVNSSVCPSGTYADNTTFTCMTCVSPCSQCSSSSICITCVQDYFLNGTHCLGLCPDGTYPLNNSGVITCISCNISCTTCAISASNCTSCSNNTYLFNSSCISSSSCPSGTYANTNNSVCTNCSSPCLACSGQSSCLSCLGNSSVYLTNGTCFSTCPNATISMNVSGINICLSCSSMCSSCIGNISICSSCSNSSQFLYNGSCYSFSSCPNGTFANNTVSICQTCSSPCQQCLNMTYCLTCISSTYLINSTCRITCPDGTVALNISSTGLCQTCQYPCSTCTNSISKCTSCQNTNSSSPLYYYNFTCFNSSQCPQQTYSNNITLKCQSCTSPCSNCQSLAYCLSCVAGYYLNSSNNSCVTSCQNGTIAINLSTGGVCSTCTYPCALCTVSLTNCLSCLQINQTLYLINGSCVSSSNCSNSTYANSSTLKCESCLSICSSCLNYSICSTCSSGYYLSGSSCLSTCPNGSVGINSSTGGQCQACSYPCSDCAITLTNCSSCSQSNGTLYLLNNNCVSSNSCINGTYPNSTTLKCETCNTNCTACTLYSTCQNCSSGYYLSNLSCSTTCKTGTLPQNSSAGGICQACTYPCTSCSNSLSNCLSCSQTISILYLLGNSCVSNASCTNGTYPNSTTFKCQICVIACSTCLTLNECSSCSSGYYLNGSSCGSNCPNGKVGDNSSRICVDCTPPCNSCIWSQTICTSCISPLLYYSLNSSCISSCPNGYYPNISALTCILCVSPCLLCTSNIICITCISNYYLLNNNSCVSTCPNGYYNDVSNLICQICTNNCSSCVSSTTCTSCSYPYLYYNLSCGTTCPSSASYNLSNSCSTCQQAITGCLFCNSSLSNALCLLCSSTYTLSQGQCISPSASAADITLSNTLHTSTIFPLPFTITGSIIFIACFMSKLQNKNSYVVGTAYSLFGFIESACLVYTMLVYHFYVVQNSPAIDYQIYLQAGLIVIACLNIFGLIVQSYQLKGDQRFTRWCKSKCNFCCYLIVTLLSCIFNYKFKMLIFTKLFSFYCLRAQLQSVQKFRIFNVMSFLGVGHQGLVIYISTIIMVTISSQKQLFLSFLDLIIVNVLNICLALVVSSKQESFFVEEEEDGTKLNKVFNIYDDSYANNDGSEETKKVGMKEKGGVESRDILMDGDDDDDFTLSLSEGEHSLRNDQSHSKITIENASKIIKKNRSAILQSDGNGNHENDHQPQTGNSLKRNTKDLLNPNSNNFSAVYQGDLSSKKRKKFEDSHKISKDITEKSKHSDIAEKNQESSQKEIKANIFDVGDQIQVQEIEKQDELNNMKKEEKIVEQFDQFQLGQANQMQVFVKGQVEQQNDPNDQATFKQKNELNPSNQQNRFPVVRQIKVYKGKQVPNEPQDIEQIDLTIGKKQKQLIQLRKSIKRKQLERQKSQQKKSRKNSSSKDKYSKDVMSQVGGIFPRHKEALSTRGLQEPPTSSRLQVIHNNMEASKLEVDERLITPPSKQLSNNAKQQQSNINQQISEQKLAPTKINNLMSKEPLQQSIIIDQSPEIKLQKKIQLKQTPIQQQINKSLAAKQRIEKNSHPNDTLTGRSNNTTKTLNKLKVDFQEIDREYDNKYQISPRRDQQNYNIEEMDYQFKDPTSEQHRDLQQNIFEYKKQENSFISQDPSSVEKRKLIGLITSKPQPHKKIQPDSQNNLELDDEGFQLKIAPDSQNNPLQNKMKTMNKKSIYNGNKFFNDKEDALDEIVDRTSRNQVGKNRSHLMRKSNEHDDRDRSLDGKKHNFNQEMRGIPTQESNLYHQLNDNSTFRESSDKEFTQRKFLMNRPPMQNQRPATTQKNRMYITGLKQMGQMHQKTSMQGETQRNEQIGVRTSFGMNFRDFKSKQMQKDGESNFEMYPSSFGSNQIQLDSDELIRQPKKPTLSRVSRIKHEELREEQGSLQDSFARKSIKSYKSRSIDRDEYEQKQEQGNLRNSRKKSTSRGQDNDDDLNEYYKKNRDSPSNRSKKSRSHSRQGSSDNKRTRQLQKIYLQRLQFKK